MNDRQMRAYVVKLVRDTIAAHGLPPRPTVPQVVAALGLPEPSVASLPAGQSGMRSGRQITINSRLTSLKRVEFTAFHEIVHILIEEDGEILSSLHDHFYSSSEQKEAWALEELCQVGAAEFVMPAAPFVEVMRGQGWKISSITTAADEFQCSVIAAAFQFAYCHPVPCTVLVCEYGVPPRAEMPALTLEVERVNACLFAAYTARGPDSYPMCRYAAIPRHHLIHRVWEDGSTGEGEDVGFFRTPNTWRIACEAARIGGRVYAAYYPRGRQVAPTQPSLFD
jgi:hypothetical protein